VTAGEQCDDGNLIDGDGCDSNCTLTGCGNGVVTAGEQCDDGNVANGDCCSATCQFEVTGSPCGDDGDACTADTCNGAGQCTHTVAPGAPCNLDGNLCTDDVCDATGACVGGPPTDCSDGDPCTVDGCSPRVGCTHIDTCGTADSALVAVGYGCLGINYYVAIAGAFYFDPITFNVMGTPVDLSTVGPVEFTGSATADGHFQLGAAAADPLNLSFGIPQGYYAGYGGWGECLLGGICFIGDLINGGSAAFPVLAGLALTLDGHFDGSFGGLCATTPPPEYDAIRTSGPIALNAFRPISTPAGTDVTVSVNNVYFDSFLKTTGRKRATVRFAEVLAPGDTVVRLKSNSASRVSAGISVPGIVPFIGITTTATIQAPITTCTEYADFDNDGIVDGTSIAETSLRFLHDENGVFVDRTVSLDTAANVICGETSHLSQFTVGTRVTASGVCGNGFVDAGEQCDDGNTVSGDCCSATCQAEDLGSTTCGVGACSRTVQNCVSGVPQTCTAGTPGVEGPPGSPSCSNGIDDDCDGATDASDPGCQAELIPGGSGATDCAHEWRAALVPARNKKGLAMTRQACTDDDPTCDFGTPGDNTCTFHVAMCFNVAEQRFACTPTDVARVQLLQPSEAQPRGDAGLANRDALETALEGLQGLVRGQCTRPRARVGQLCQVNADCDSAPGSGNGLCKGRFLAFEPPLSTTNACTPFADISVPLRQTARGLMSGTATLKLKASPSNDAVTGKKRPKDNDSLTLVCKPRL
jgi:cysteine-rich repeat protein